MAATVAAALEHGVRVGAHPSYPDREGFGRQPMEIDRDELRASLSGQLRGARPDLPGRRHDPRVRQGPRRALRGGRQGRRRLRDLPRRRARRLGGRRPGAALGLPRHGDGAARRHGGERGGFLRPAYRPDGGLVDRSEAGAVLTDPGAAAAQALSLARGAVVAVDGTRAHACGSTRCASTATPPGRWRWPGGAHRHGARSGSRWSRRRVHDPLRPRREVRRLGDRALLIGVADAAAARALARGLTAALAGVRPRWCAARPP